MVRLQNVARLPVVTGARTIPRLTQAISHFRQRGDAIDFQVEQDAACRLQPFGCKNAIPVGDFKALMISIAVGMSGSKSEWVDSVKAIRRTLPALACGRNSCASPANMLTSHCTSAITALSATKLARIGTDVSQQLRECL